MKYWLVIFVFLDGAWTPGAEIEKGGWSPRAYDTLEICKTRRDFAANLVKQVGKVKAHHFCTTTPDATLEELKKAAGQ